MCQHIKPDRAGRGMNEGVFNLKNRKLKASESADKLPRRKRTGYQSENYDRPKGRGIKPSSAAGGLNPTPAIRMNPYIPGPTS